LREIDVYSISVLARDEEDHPLKISIDGKVYESIDRGVFNIPLKDIENLRLGALGLLAISVNVAACIRKKDGVLENIPYSLLHTEVEYTSDRAYLETGGFPLAIREFTEYGRMSEASRKALLDGLRGDWLRAGKSEATMKEVVSYLLEARAALLSWLSIAKNTSINSPHTARSYVDVLKDLMTITILSYVDPGGRTIHRKNRKIHFADPFIHKTLAGYCGQKVYEDALMEGVVASHLVRRYNTGYWKNKSEVDCVVVEDSRIYGFEVKTGLRRAPSPKWLKHHIVLDKETTSLFLAGFS